MQDILVQIAQVMQECAQFISKYSETESFCRSLVTDVVFLSGLISFVGSRLRKNVFSETATMVANFNLKLDQLMQELRDWAVLNVQSGIQQIRLSIQQMRGDMSLDTLACAGKVGVNQMKKCLDGTRTEILNDIVDWINSTDPTAPRILWLHSQARKGKSAIVHTIALHAKNLGNLGSCFCFTCVRQHEGLHMKLFTTIARDVVDHNLRCRLLLAEVISNDRVLRDTDDIMEQWEKFILKPLLQSTAGSSTRNVVIVIDALDETPTRKGILDILATHSADLPVNIWLLLTSQPLPDIRKSFHAKGHILTRSLDAVDSVSTTRDITFYISTELKEVDGTFNDEHFGQLTVKSDGLFEWARLACDFICPDISVIPQEHFRQVMSHAGDTSSLLDEMYITFLKDLIKGSSVLARFRSVMRQILWSKEPLSIKALDMMRDRFHLEADCYSVRIILDFMASFLSGTTKTSTPVRPLHASFYDFLLDEHWTGEFFIDEAEIHHDLALATLGVMQANLRFNMCAFLTSYLCNSEVMDLAKRVKENIPMQLLYSCRFWAAHLQGAEPDAELGQQVKEFVTGEKILFWMEVLDVSKFIGEAYMALVSAEKWSEVRPSSGVK